MLINMAYGEAFSFSSFVIRGGDSYSGAWSWDIMSSAWFYLYNKGGDMTIDFRVGER
jgi:hypothetical protein